MAKAILLSGGLDSTAVAFWVRPKHAIFVDYGQQSAEGESRASAAVCDQLGIRRHTIQVDLRGLGSGEMAAKPELPLAPNPEWWPYRNQMLVTLALMYAAPLGLEALIAGTVKSDRASGDGAPEFWHALGSAVELQEGKVRLETPAIDLSTSELILASGAPRDLLGWTLSCHRGSFACGQCRGCRRRRAAFEEAGLDLY